MKESNRKRDKKAAKKEERKVTFNENVQTMPKERTWNDFKNRPMKKGTFEKEEMDELISSLINFARETSTKINKNDDAPDVEKTMMMLVTCSKQEL